VCGFEWTGKGRRKTAKKERFDSNRFEVKIMKIREAKKADVKQIEGLSDRLMDCHLQFDEYYKLRGDSDMEYVGYFEALVSSKDSTVFVAEDNGIIVGYLAGKIEKRPPVFEVGERG
jgi:hypothetical protein